MKNLKMPNKTAELKSPNKTAVKNNTNNTLEQILLILSDGKEYSNNEIATSINKSERRTRELLTILIDNKQISSTGATRNRKYKKLN